MAEILVNKSEVIAGNSSERDAKPFCQEAVIYARRAAGVRPDGAEGWFQVGQATGIWGANGEISLDMPLRIMDSDANALDVMANLTTGFTAGFDDGVQICPGPSPVCEGTPIDPATGSFRLVDLVEISDASPLSVAGRALFLQIEGLVPVGDSDGDGVSDADEDADGDGLSNGLEFRLGLNPQLVDSDGDGVFVPNVDTDEDLGSYLN